MIVKCNYCNRPNKDQMFCEGCGAPLDCGDGNTRLTEMRRVDWGDISTCGTSMPINIYWKSAISSDELSNLDWSKPEPPPPHVLGYS